jgi:hypothetical protein
MRKPEPIVCCIALITVMNHLIVQAIASPEALLFCRLAL